MANVGGGHNLVVYDSARGRKPEEDAERQGNKLNTIGTLSVANPQSAPQSGIWAATPPFAMHASVGPALLQAIAQNPNAPMLWIMKEKAGSYQFYFGFDLNVPAAGGVGVAKVGHVGLAKRGTISGEIHQTGASWSIDNNSGAWGAMGGNDGKSDAMGNAALLISRFDPGGMVVNAQRAYSRNAKKRFIQQIFR